MIDSTDKSELYADTNRIIDAMIRHKMDSIMRAGKFVSKYEAYRGEDEFWTTFLAISVVVLIISSAIGYYFFNRYYWERGVFPPRMLNTRINRFEAYVCLSANILYCDSDNFMEKKSALVRYLRNKFPSVIGGVNRSLSLAYRNPMTTRSLAHWLNKRLKTDEDRRELLDFLFSLAVIDGVAGQREYAVLLEYTREVGIPKQYLDEKLEHFRRARAEELYEEMERLRRRKAASATDYKREKALEVLGLTGEADPEEIKKAFRTLAKQFHPDRFQLAGKEEQRRMELRFMELQEAYEYLTS